MPLRTRTKKSFSERTSLRTLRSKATETRLTSIEPESLIDPPPPVVPELELGDFSFSAEAVMTMNGSALGTAATSLNFSSEAIMTMAGSSSGIETGSFSFIAEGSITFAGEVASNAADFSSTAESSMVFVGVEQSIVSGDLSFTAESVMTFQGSFIGGTAQGDLFTGAEASMSMVGTTADAAEGDISISAESAVTVAGAAISASNISVLAEAVATLRGASINPSSFSSIAEAVAIMQSDDTPMAGVYTEGPLAAQQVSPYTAYLTYLDTWENWLGNDVVMVQDLIAYTGGATTSANWTKINTPTYIYGWGTWKAAAAGREVMLRVPMAPQFVAPDTLPTDLCAQIASGIFDSHYQTLATNLNANGLGAAHLRIGSRLNASGEPWYAPVGSDNASNFAAAFRRIVDVMEAQVPGNDWKFSIAVEAEAASNGLSWWNLIWPGDAYVHKIGIHVYDQSWLFGTTVSYIDGTMSEATKAARRAQVWDQINGWLLFIRDFAIAHNKILSFDEWASVQRTDNHGGGDNPTFIQNVHNFINTPANRVFSQCYANTNWSSGLRCEIHPPSSNGTGIGDFPNGSAKYLELFGLPGPEPDLTVQFGVWGFSPSAVTSFEQWCGRAVKMATDTAINYNSGWPGWATANNIGPRWQAWLQADPSRNIHLTTPLCPHASTANGGNLQYVANGSSDQYWRQFADYLFQYGMTKAVIRLGWEFDGSWYPWRCKNSDNTVYPTNANYFAAAFTRAKNVMQDHRPTNQWKFNWCVSNAKGSPQPTSFLDLCWPGDNNVDEVGQDTYDIWGCYPIPNWQTATEAEMLVKQQCTWTTRVLGRINQIADYGLAHGGKPMTFPEWGVQYYFPSGGWQSGPPYPTNYGGCDSSYFIEQMFNWMNTHPTAWHCYFNLTPAFGPCRIQPPYQTNMPFTRAAAKFLQLF